MIQICERCGKPRGFSHLCITGFNAAELDAGPQDTPMTATEVNTRKEGFFQGLGAKSNQAQSPLATQEGGSHYKNLKIQPIEYIHANSIPFAEGSVIKYVTRWRDKGGLADLKKARHFLDLLIELETRGKEGGAT